MAGLEQDGVVNRPWIVTICACTPLSVAINLSLLQRVSNKATTYVGFNTA